METVSNPLAEPAPKKRKSYYLDADAFLSQCDTALRNAADPEVAPLLATRGYTSAILTAKQTELGTLKQLVADQKKEYGDQYAATKAFSDAVDGLHPEYMDHLALARIALKKDTAAQTALGLKGRRLESESGYCSQALLFYSGELSNTAYQTALAGVGVTEAELEAAKGGYEALAVTIAKKAKETGEAQAATVKRDRAIDAFGDWFGDFKEVAIVALRKQPQLREKLGWKE